MEKTQFSFTVSGTGQIASVNIQISGLFTKSASGAILFSIQDITGKVVNQGRIDYAREQWNYFWAGFVSGQWVANEIKTATGLPIATDSIVDSDFLYVAPVPKV